MAKNQKKENSKASVKIKPAERVAPLDENSVLEKFFWLVIPLLTALYFLSSKYSVGFYQDDEVGQYINMIKFWSDPFAILGNSPKPGYKIFLVIPSLFGYESVLLVNSFIASLSVYFTYVLLKVYNIRYAFFGALLLSVQPLFFDLSFRSYAEIFTSLLILLVLISYKKEYYFISGLLLGYIFTVRQEILLLMAIFAFIFFRKKEYAAIIALGIFPLIYDLLGYLKTGDILYIISEIQALNAYSYKSQGVFHYVVVYIFVIGPVTLLLFLQGFFGFFADTKNYREYFKKYGIFYIIFVTVFLVQMMTMFGDRANPGNWRYLLHISPVAAIFATIGLNNLAIKEFRNTSYIITGILAFITLAFLSKTTDGFILLDISDYTKFFIIMAAFTVILLLKKDSSADYVNKLSIILILIAVFYLYVSFNPKKLSSENVALKQTSEFINSIDYKGKEIYYNHSFIPFYQDNYYRESPDKLVWLVSESLKNAKPGSIIIWDSHYSYRPKDMKTDVRIEDLKDNPDFRLLKTVSSADGRFTSFVFEKLN